MAAKKKQEKPKTAERPTSILLSEMQAAYVEATLDGKLPADAARAAGYAHPLANAEAPLRSESVRTAIAAGRNELSSLTQLTRADVIDGIMEAIGLARLNADPATMVKGWTEVGKMLGHYAPEVKKLEVDMATGNFTAKLRALTDAELLNIIEGECREVQTLN